jgi:hypothetical protein
MSCRELSQPIFLRKPSIVRHSERCHQYIDAGVSKLVLSPMARGDADIADQTARLLDEVVPAVEVDLP